MRKVVIKLISGYQKFLSPLKRGFNIKCKYYPSCSEYTKQAVEKYGVVKGMGKGIVRILKCNPFSNGGYDPLK